MNHLCCKDGWKLIYAKSRFTKGPELGYKPIEGEAIVYDLCTFVCDCVRLEEM